jgi:hypothetical protein
MLWDLRLPVRYHSRTQQMHLHPVWQQLDAHKPLPAPGSAPAQPRARRKADAPATARPSVTSVLFLNGDRQLATAAAADTTVRFWDLRNLRACVQTLQPKLLPMNCLEQAPGARPAAAGYERLCGSLGCSTRGDKVYGVLSLALAPQGGRLLGPLHHEMPLRCRPARLSRPPCPRPPCRPACVPDRRLAACAAIKRPAPVAGRTSHGDLTTPQPPKPPAQATSSWCPAATTRTTSTTPRAWAPPPSPRPCSPATAAPPTTWTRASARTAAWRPAARQTGRSTCGAWVAPLAPRLRCPSPSPVAL